MATKKKAQAQTPEIHGWTHDHGEVLIVKCVGPNGETHNGFRWPLTVGAEVEAPDWKPVAECGYGLHVWPWGLSIGDGKEPDWTATWLVFATKPEDVIDLGGKVKAKCGRVVYVGDWQGATNFVLAGQIAWVVARAEGAEETSKKDSGAASATGESSIAAVTGLDGRARGGAFSAIALAFYHRDAERQEMRCARIGIGDGSDGHLKANVFYRLDEAGQFVEVAGA